MGGGVVNPDGLLNKRCRTLDVELSNGGSGGNSYSNEGRVTRVVASNTWVRVPSRPLGIQCYIPKSSGVLLTPTFPLSLISDGGVTLVDQ